MSRMGGVTTLLARSFLLYPIILIALVLGPSLILSALFELGDIQLTSRDHVAMYALGVAVGLVIETHLAGTQS